MELNEGQKELKRRMLKWYKELDKPYYYFAGRAGTGKTTVVRAMIEDLNLEYNEYITCAYVGKAVMVLLRKGYNASTLHSLLYNVIFETLTETKYDSDGDPFNSKKIVMRFELKKALNEAIKLIIVDEAKMVADKMIMELLSFGIPTIFMGDENQLPPVMGSSNILKTPDYTLTELMRQAEDDPIVMFANWVLDDVPLKYGTYGKSKIVDRVNFDKTLLTDYDAILCGKNRTRESLNKMIRNQILHYPDNKIMIGEKLICRQNNWDLSLDGIYLTNGMVGFADDIHYEQSKKKMLMIDFRPDFLDEGFVNVELDKEFFFASIDERQNYGISRFNKFEYGYALTTHLAQGSEYDRVLMFKEYLHDKKLSKRLWYTGITRAKESITLVA